MNIEDRDRLAIKIARCGNSQGEMYWLEPEDVELFVAAILKILHEMPCRTKEDVVDTLTRIEETGSDGRREMNLFAKQIGKMAFEDHDEEACLIFRLMVPGRHRGCVDRLSRVILESPELLEEVVSCVVIQNL